MSTIHQTTVRPSKIELLTPWLPSRAWYRGGAGRPRPAKAGGFRLDDPAGEVGIEFMVVTDTAAERPATYLVPLTYRGAPLEGAEDALVGTMEHGVLGPRWAYDGAHDPVLVGQLLALIAGRAEAQAQSVSDTPDREVARALAGVVPAVEEFAAPTVVDDEDGTALIATSGATLHLRRILAPAPHDGHHGSSPRPGAAGHVVAAWNRPDGTRVRGVVAELRN